MAIRIKIIKMDYEKLIQGLNASWLEKRAALGKDELALIANKDTLRRRLIGVGTRSYLARSRLIKEGDILYAYAFKSWRNEIKKDDFDYPTWIVFSPERKIAANPQRLKEITAKIRSLPEKGATKTEKRLKHLCDENLSDCSYFEIPLSCADGDLAFMSIIYLRVDAIPDFHLGLNPIIANRSLSTETLYLPERCWTEDFKKAYLGNELAL